MQVQQYQQQVAGLAYRSRQQNIDNAQAQMKADSINRIDAVIRNSDSLKLVYYQNRLARAQQQEEEIKKNERRGLLVKKSDELKAAEKEREEATSRLQIAQATRQKDEQNSRVATGDTLYISSLQAQLNRRQTEIDSLKKTKKALDIFTDKNKRIKELEQQQNDQQRQIDEANRMLQYYRTTGPTSYYQPDNSRRQIDNLNDRIDDLQNQRYSNYRNPPVNVVSPVVVSDNNDERRRMQREIDSLRSQVSRLQQVRRDTVRQPSVSSVMLDSNITTNKPVIASVNPASQMAALQKQLAELNNRLNAVTSPANTKQTPVVNDTAVLNKISGTVYFTRGSVVLAALQKAFVKYGFGKFKFCIYEYFSYESRIISHKSLTGLDTSYLSKFKLETLYNFSLIAHNNLGYKHTNESKLKISKPGDLNPMFGKTHNTEAKEKMSMAKSKTPLGLYDLENNLVKTFTNQVELAAEFGVNKTTISRKIRSGKIFNGKYYIRKLNN
jgi:uncharacterized coiled-coil protein SlyX